jgi:fluoride exporter
MRIGIAVAAGGALGSAARFALGVVLPDDPVGVGVVMANLLGALVLGFAAGRTAAPLAVAFWRVGVLGAFTTASGLAVQAAALPATAAVAYTAGQLLLGVGFAAIGLRLAGGVPGTTATRGAPPSGGVVP